MKLLPTLRRLALLGRFFAAGLVNTAIGLSTIAALDLGLHVHPHLANAVGYAGGMTSGYLLNRMFVFRARGDWGATGLKYLIAIGVAFFANQVVLTAGAPLYGPQPLGRLLAQVTAMVSYTGLTFLLYRLWVFRPQSPSRAAKASTAGQSGSNT